MDKIKIANIEFGADDWQHVCALAQRKNKKLDLATQSQPNILRLALGLAPRKRGGARPNTGNRKEKSLG